MGETEQMLNHNFSFKAITSATRESQGQGSSGKKPSTWKESELVVSPTSNEMVLVGARSKEG